MKKIALSFGDPNSISPEISIKALNFLDIPSNNIVLITNPSILDYYKKNLDLYLEKKYEIIEIPYDIKNLKIGQETKEGGEFSFQAIKMACELANENEIEAITTAPVSKNAMKLAGYNFSGQTEILEHYLAKKNEKAQMVFISDDFMLLLLTRHIALNRVSDFIKQDLIIDRIEKLVYSLKGQLNIENPSIAVCALNPHGGENGMFGLEEIEEIIPAVKKLKANGINIEGPFPSDSLFAKCVEQSSKYDCYIAMYHDQGLIPMKLLYRDNCVNTTIGLNVLRTSPSHGTAYDIAGRNEANPNSMICALKLALKNCK